MGNKLKLSEFLVLVEAGELDRLEILAYIDLVTGNFKVDMLEALLHEVEFHIFNRRDEIESKYHERILELVIQYQQQGKQVPYKTIKFPKGDEHKILDKDKILGGAITWDLYPLFELQREIVAKLKKTTQTAASQQAILPDVTPTSSDFNFSHYLTEDGKRMYPVLQELYSHVKFKKEYAIMLHALKELGYLVDEHFIGQEQLHQALQATFKDVGSRQNLVKYLGNYSNPSVHERQEIDRHKQKILESTENLA